MAARSAGLLLWRKCAARNAAPVRDEDSLQIEVLLVHPGGPFWAKKDAGAWTIPKGMANPGEDELSAARREFLEETGHVTEGQAIPIGEIRQAGGKVVVAWAVEGQFDPAQLRSNMFSMEWPPGSGKSGEFPEVDRAGWFRIDEAKSKILNGQIQLLERLQVLLPGHPLPDVSP